MACSNHSPTPTDNSIMRQGHRDVIVISSDTSDAGSCLDGEVKSPCQTPMHGESFERPPVSEIGAKLDPSRCEDIDDNITKRAVAKMENKNKKEEDNNETKENEDEDEHGEEDDNKTEENEDDDDENGEEDDDVKNHKDENGEEDINDKGKDETKEDLADSFYTCKDRSLPSMVWSTDEYSSDHNDTPRSRK